MQPAATFQHIQQFLTGDAAPPAAQQQRVRTFTAHQILQVLARGDAGGIQILTRGELAQHTDEHIDGGFLIFGQRRGTFVIGQGLRLTLPRGFQQRLQATDATQVVNGCRLDARQGHQGVIIQHPLARPIFLLRTLLAPRGQRQRRAAKFLQAAQPLPGMFGRVLIGRRIGEHGEIFDQPLKPAALV